MKAILIINPSSGKMRRKMPPILKWTLDKLGRRLAGLFKPKTTEDDVTEEVKKKCDEAKIKLDIEFTKYPKHATELAKVAREKYDLIIAAGGDGTINEVINGMATSKATLVIIPFGTTNVLACELGIPNNPEEASELITKGKKIKMDLGYATTNEGSRYFSMMLGVGPFAQVIKDMTPKFKKRWGRFAYPFGIIKLLFRYKWHEIHVKHKVDSTGYFVIMANIKYYAGEYEIADEANIRDGFLDLVVINRKKPWDIFVLIFSFTIGKLNKYLRKEYYQTKEADIYSHHKMQIQVDGEFLGIAPVNVKIIPEALNVITGSQNVINRQLNQNH
jgi:YegS/Rv2252/BmrU family lipid kinase